ncbi:hypothetical protein [Delftia tsuruhatensis]|uniref:Uncharacterized protein n=1 Tax=Delftia tsuruhatensis TaxID=180282 RepID=A0ABM6E5Y5_9BURK|nr:hypothetical protein [Delftia tsuruhatensis]AOV02765.1 hypothetical protein BI380_16175 [Delftia tsuruhatensis]
MSFSVLLRRVERQRNLCVKRGLPGWLQQYAEAQLAHARYRWLVSRDKQAPTDCRRLALERAVSVLFSLQELLRVYRVNCEQRTKRD